MNDERKMYLVSVAIAVAGVLGFVFTITMLSGCAAGKVIATDAKACATAQIATAVSSATTQFLTAAAMSNGSQDAYIQIGASLALKYGTDVAWCTITKAWADLGGPSFLAAHLQPSKELVAADYLINHKTLWIK